MADLYAIMAWDAPEGPARRDEFRAAHFAHIETFIEKIAVAGPLYADDGGFAGSLVVVHADSKADAEAILRSDPYFAGGVWARWDIHRFLGAAGDWVGGKTW
jgi:uncharacterized protein